MTDFFKFRNSLEEAKCGSKNTKREEEKLDPVGKADADIDNDGDVDSSDEYLKNRRKAISKAMKKEDKGPCWDGYKQVGTKMKDGKEVPNCVPEETVKEARRKKTGSVIDDIESTIDSKMKDVEKDLSPRARKKIQSAQDDYLSALRDLEDFVNSKKNEETLSEVREPFAVIDTADNDKVVATASSEKGAKESIASAERPPMRIKDKNTLKVVKTRKKQDVGFPLKEETLSEGYYDYPDYGPIGASEMAQTQLHFIKYAADDITRCLKMGCPMPEWYQNKLAKIEGDMEGLYSYMKGKTRKMKAHQADRYSMGMSMYGEETLNEARSDRSDASYLNMFYFVAKKERGKTVYLQYDGSIEIGKMGEEWVENPDFATAYDSKRNAQKHAKRFGGKVQKGVEENKSSNDDGYDEFFQAALKKFGVKGIGELDKEKKKEFFNYVDKNWKGDKEKTINEVLKPSDDVSTWIEDFYKSDAPQFKGKNKEERREMAVAAWLEARREAGYDVDPNPNKD